MISKKNFVIAGILSLLLAIFWQWRSAALGRSQAERALYLSYVSGPLTDYSLALTRSLPLLHGEKAPDLADARKSAALSAADLGALLGPAVPSATRGYLEEALPLHQALPGQIEAWKNSKKSDWLALLAAEEASRAKLVFILETLRYQGSEKWRLTKAQQLEINALIYSLKELSGSSPR
jgi:hypothetical protein